MSDNQDSSVCLDKTMLREYILAYGSRQFGEGFLFGFVEGLLLGVSFTVIAYTIVKQK